MTAISLLHDAPQWLRDAATEDADVTIEDGRVIWHGGTWHAGIWYGGTWCRGTWHGGTWHAGIWYGGTWRGGTWHGGIWYRGTWRGGTCPIQEPRISVPADIAREAIALLDDAHWIRGADERDGCYCAAGAILAAGGTEDMCAGVRNWNDAPSRTAREVRDWLARAEVAPLDPD